MAKDHWLDSALVIAPGELPAERHPMAVYLSTKSTAGRPGLARVLDRCARIITAGQVDAPRLAWHRLEYQHTHAMIVAMMKIYSPATVNLARAAIRGVLRQSWRLGLISAEEYERTADMPRARGTRERAGRALKLAELRAVLQVCLDDQYVYGAIKPAGARDAALIGLAYGCGMRRTEIISLNREDYNTEEKSILIHGKGSKERRVFIPAGAVRALTDWLEWRDATPFLQGPPLFFPILKNGRIVRRRMSPKALLDICRKRARQAKVDSFSIHDLRRSYVTHLFDAGADVSMIAELVGHTNIQTTQLYDRRGDETKRKAATLIHVPYGHLPTDDDGVNPTEKITATL